MKASRMPSTYKGRLFLDGGYDRDEVEACAYHPAHRWTVLRLGDVYEHPRDPDELHVVCRNCLVPRCGHTTEENPCMLPRHHPEKHLFADGTPEDEHPSGVWAGSTKPDP